MPSKHVLPLPPFSGLFRIPKIRCFSTQVTVTDPLVIYQNLVESDVLQTDEAQFRAAVE